MNLFWIILAVVAVGFYIIYANLIRTKNTALEALSGIDVQLSKRHALIPNLVATAKGAMDHERGVFEEITRLRAEAVSANVKAGGAETAKAFGIEAQLSALLGRLMVSVEAYPELKTSENMLELQRALAEIEANLSAARRFYNSAAGDLKNSCEIFPSSIVAGMIGVKPMPFFEADEAARSVPSVSSEMRQS